MRLARKNLAFMLQGLGYLALVFFILNLLDAYRRGEIWDILWICNIAELLLGLGVVSNNIRISSYAALWAIPGATIWLADAIINDLNCSPISAASHLITFCTGLFWIRFYQMPRNSWLFSLSLFLFLQLVSHMFTPAYLNVNISHAIMRGWESWFESYIAYWICTTAMAATCLWLLERLAISMFTKSNTSTDH